MFKEAGEKKMTVTNVMISMVVCYILGMFIMGIPMGRKSLSVWKKAEKESPGGCTGGFWGYVLFPLNASQRNVGSSKWMPIGIEEQYYKNNQNAAEYISFTALLWPFRIVFNALSLFVCGLLQLGIFLQRTLSKMIKE